MNPHPAQRRDDRAQCPEFNTIEPSSRISTTAMSEMMMTIL
jgi:hypothetical protein